jgi:hypothetical protein
MKMVKHSTASTMKKVSSKRKTSTQMKKANKNKNITHKDRYHAVKTKVDETLDDIRRTKIEQRKSIQGCPKNSFIEKEVSRNNARKQVEDSISQLSCGFLDSF